MALFLSGDIHECIYIYRDIETWFHEFIGSFNSSPLIYSSIMSYLYREWKCTFSLFVCVRCAKAMSLYVLSTRFKNKRELLLIHVIRLINKTHIASQCGDCCLYILTYQQLHVSISTDFCTRYDAWWPVYISETYPLLT